MKKHIVDLKTGTKKDVALTQDEIDEIALYKAQSLAGKPMRDWKAKMAKTDNPKTGMTQAIFWHIKEDHGGITGNPTSQGKYDAKKIIHNSKPQE